MPTNLNECTKRGIIIRHINSDDIFLYKADFKEDKDILGHRNYYFEQQNIIAKGEEDVINTLNGLNYAFNDKIEDSFYYIITRIKLFDDMQIADSLKQKIFLIDFPGFGTGNIFEKKNIYNKVLSICHLFVFVVRNSVIKENSFKSKLKDIFDKAQIEKKKLISQFIKSCLFILNNDIDQSTSEDDLKKVKENIQEMLNFKLDDINDMKLCFFNAKYYDNFCSNYNYFYDINNLFKKEFDDYTKKKYSFFKNPFSFNISKKKQ